MTVPGGYDAQRHNYWPAVAGVMPKPWPREASCMDLLWHVAESRVFGRAFPSRSQFADRWGWTEKRVRVLLADPESWQDQERPAGVDELRPKRKGQTRARQGPDKGQTGANPERLAADDLQERASEGPAKGRTGAGQGPQARVFTDTDTDTGIEHNRPASGAPSADADGFTSADRRHEPRPATQEANTTPPPPTSPGGLFAAPRLPAPPQPPPKPKRQPKGDPTGYHEAIRLFGDAYATKLGRPYPWRFKGQGGDGGLVKSWLAAGKVTEGAPEEGLARIRDAVAVYLAAETDGKVFPFGKLPSTGRFSRELAEWFGRDPGDQGPPRRGEYRSPTMPKAGDQPDTFSDEEVDFVQQHFGA